MIASHNLDELERLADRVAIVDRGTLVRIVDTRAEVSETAVTRYRIAYRGDESVVREVFPGATMPGPSEVEVSVTGLEELNRALVALIERGVLVSSATPAYSALEEHELAERFFGEFIARIYGFIGGYLEERQRDGAFREFDARVAVRAFLGMVIHHSINNILWDKDRNLLNISNEEAASEFAEIMLRGIKA